MQQTIKPLDILTLIYIFISTVILFIGWNTTENSLNILSIYLILIVIIFFLIKYSSKYALLRIIHHWYPIIFWGFLFQASTQLNQVFWNGYWDNFFQKIDEAIFGYQPAIIWGTKYNSFFWQEFFHFWYFSFYIMIAGIGLLFYLKDRKLFHSYFFTISFVFYICYLTYYFIPVIGGRYWEITLANTKEYQYGIFTRLMAFLYNRTEHWGGAIPSSHVAVATAVTIAAFRFKKYLGWILLAGTVLLSISTVYCHYHYFIDTPFGILYGILFYYLGLKIYRKMEIYV
jgi:membrane-associated phospholipid phosphatase